MNEHQWTEANLDGTPEGGKEVLNIQGFTYRIRLIFHGYFISQNRAKGGFTVFIFAITTRSSFPDCKYCV